MELMTNNKMTMTSFEVSELLGSRHDSVKRAIERLVEKGSISQPPLVDGVKKANGIIEKGFLFSGEKGKRDTYVLVAQLSPEFTALIVDRWQELEKQLSAPPVPQLPANYIEALEALVVSEKEKAQIAYERDEAIKTKALIGSKREATAMGKAGVLAKEVKKLKEQLDQSSQFSSIKRMEIMHSGKSFDWRKLKKASIQLGLPINEIADQNYGSVKTYHAEAWAMVYQLDIAEGL